MAKGGARKIGVWVILGLLFVGLIGFGTTGLSGRITRLGTVGDKDISVQDYAAELDRQIRARSAATGEPITMQQALAMGLDRQAQSQLVAIRALDNEAARLGLSVGDEAVAGEVRANPAFQGLDGQFDREGYRELLRREGLSEEDYETRVREDIARSFLQAAIAGGVPDPDTYAALLAGFLGEQRDVRYVTITADTIQNQPLDPQEGEAEAFYEANPEMFTAPEIRQIDYAWLTPEMIQDEVEVDEQNLRDLYDQRIDQFVQPERRLVERLVMSDQAAGEDAMAQIEVGGATFDTLVTDRGLDLADIDMGDVTEADLGPAGEEVFAAEVGDVVGPLPSDFGPALYRVNAVLNAQEITFEEALPDLREELAGQVARRTIDAAREGINDLMAGGAGPADLAEATDMEFGQIDWSPEVTEGIAAYAAFREAAAVAEQGAFPELREFEDGGIFVIALTGVVPPQVRPFEEVEDQVLAAMRQEAVAREVVAEAEQMMTTILETGDFTDSMPEPVAETGLTRRSFLDDLPIDFTRRIFEVDEGEVAMTEEDGRVVIAIVDAVRAADPEDPDLASRSAAIAEQAGAAIRDDLMLAFMTEVQERTDVSIDQAAVTAVHTDLQ